jgi:hypothetical protein
LNSLLHASSRRNGDLELARQRFDQPEKIVGHIVHRLK